MTTAASRLAPATKLIILSEAEFKAKLARSAAQPRPQWPLSDDKASCVTLVRNAPLGEAPPKNMAVLPPPAASTNSISNAVDVDAMDDDDRAHENLLKVTPVSIPPKRHRESDELLPSRRGSLINTLLNARK